MNTYQPEQQLVDLRWGTLMPIMTMVNSNLVQLRARGKFSAIIADPAKFSIEVPDPNNPQSYLNSIIVTAITDMLIGSSQTASDVGQLTTVTYQTVEALHTVLESKFMAIGLQLKDVSIDAIESL